MAKHESPNGDFNNCKLILWGDIYIIHTYCTYTFKYSKIQKEIFAVMWSIKKLNYIYIIVNYEMILN